MMINQCHNQEEANMFTKEQEAIVRNVIEVVLASILIATSLNYMIKNPNYFYNIGAISFLLAGVLIIVKANWEWKKRAKDKDKDEK